MSNWQKRIHRFVWKAETGVDRLKHQFRDTMGLDGDWHIQMYHGYANEEVVRVEGRVLQDRNISVSQDDSYFTNLLNAYKRLGSREAPMARVSVKVLDQIEQLTTDDEGYFQIDIPHQRRSTPENLRSSARLLSHEPFDRDFEGKVFTPGKESGLAVISDVDDTILVTGAVSIRQMARWTFLHNAYSRRRIVGVGAWYRAIQSGMSGQQQNPVFYVSSSPWNFFDLIDDFIRLNQIPAGPLLLRDYGIDEGKLLIEPHGDHKIKRCEELFSRFLQLKFLLIGDAGQEDTFIYRDLLIKHPDRIAAAIIRSVEGNSKEEAIMAEIRRLKSEGLPIHFIHDSVDGAKICQEMGMMTQEQVEEVEIAVRNQRT